MFALVEPINMNGLSTLPHLGCAMLIASCRDRGIKTTLVKGQTRYLKDMFVNDSDELWYLIQDLEDEDARRIGIAEYRKFIRGKGIKQFRDELEILYREVIVSKDPRHYYNAGNMTKFNRLHDIFIATYFYYLTELNCAKLNLPDRYVSEIVNSNSRYAGFSLEGSFGPLSRAIRKGIKDLTGMPIIVGGALTPFIDWKTLDQLFKEECMDYLIIGAGEEALPRLIEAIEDHKEPTGIPNLVYRKNGGIKINDLREIYNLNDLPFPDYSQFDLDFYPAPERILPLQTARGCTWRKCAFCSHHRIYSGHYKALGIERLMDTIHHLRNTYRCTHITLHDEELPPGRARRITEAILGHRLEAISLAAYARPVGGYTDELLRLMRKAGFRLIHWGVESGCQRVLNRMNKGTRVPTVSRVLKASSENKIANLCFVMFGFPGETKKDAQHTVEYLQAHAAHIEDVLLSPFSVDPHSPLCDQPEQWGVQIDEGGSYSVDSGMSAVETNTFLLRFQNAYRVNSIRVTSDKLKYLPPGHNRRMLHFLNSSHDLLSKTVLLESLRKGTLDRIYPIVLGEVKRKGNRALFYPVNTRETDYINRYFPVGEIDIDPLKKMIFALSNGTLSIEEVVLAVCRGVRGRIEKERIREKCADFFRDIFSNQWGLGFSKPWRPS